MTEDLRRLAEQLASGELIAPQVSMEDVCAFAADYLRSLDEGERLREAMKRIKQRAEAVTTDEQFDVVLTDIIHLTALPSGPSE